jgi:ElaB/YqjD/DUF883 family membrane-anchored ribosome-binding protein
MEEVERQGRGSDAGAQAGELVAQAQQQVQDTVDEVGKRAGERVKTEIDGRSTQLGEHLTSMSRALHRAGESLRGDDRRTSAGRTDQVAGQLDRLGGYLQRADAETILADAEALARRRPWLAAGSGLVVGFVAARFLKASSANRYAHGNGRPELQRALGGRAVEAGNGMAR